MGSIAQISPVKRLLKYNGHFIRRHLKGDGVMVKMGQHATTNYTVAANAIVQDARLSWKARGVFMYLWSLPDDWEFYEQEVVTHATDGRDALRSALKELQQYGYLRRVAGRNARGQVVRSQWQLADRPGKAAPATAAPQPENPKPENPQPVKPARAVHPLPSPEVPGPKALGPKVKALSPEQPTVEAGATALPASLLQTWTALWQAPNVVARRALTGWLKTYDVTMVTYALETAGMYNVKASGAVKYVQAIVDGWRELGVTTLTAARSAAANHRASGSASRSPHRGRQELVPRWLQIATATTTATTERPPRHLTAAQRAELQARVAKLAEPTQPT